MELENFMKWINHPCTNKKGIAEKWCKIVGLKENSFYAKADPTNSKYEFKGPEIMALVEIWFNFNENITDQIWKSS